MRALGFLVAVALMSVALAGCQNIVQTAVEKATGVSVGKDGQSVTVKVKDGESVTVGAFPKELEQFPVPSGFSVKGDGGGSISSKQGQLVAAAWDGPTAVAQVVDFYRRELPGRQWKENFVTTSGDNALLQFSHNDGKREVAITLSRSGNRTEISVLMTIKP